MSGTRRLEDVSFLEGLRADAGLTRAEASIRAGVSHKTLKKYEREGLAHPQAVVCAKLARLYNVRSSLIMEDVRRLFREHERNIARVAGTERDAA